ncbi:MAG: preprotein translocase subunit SecA [Chloroflexi bacterium]|nr:preprotein translocase subunit SecA [Chloroflexota bacterium]MCL5075574.1 preprotein translocase subunit SecA [Chloroflexota bacterium]
MFKWLTKLAGDASERELHKLEPVVQQINALESEFKRLSDEELRDKTTTLRGRYLAGESLDSLLPEAFAAVREASRRTTRMRHFDVQLIGGIVLHQGKIAEMKTGEGKTLVATLPLYLNALPGEGAHLVTVNDYLAKRDTQWMGPIYHLLGLSVGVIQHESAFLYDPTYIASDPRLHHLRPVERREAYLADITYGTNNEFGFDYLRDNMVLDLSQCVQRQLNYAIVDEVDNILIDEARTPLIISGQAEESTDKYYLFARLVPRLQREIDLTIDEKIKVVMLTEEGIAKVERWLGLKNLYDPQNYELTHYLEQALKAQFIFKRDRDYVLVKDGRVIDHHDRDAEVVIVDEFTGRLMFGRRFSEGLHQAIEAKENVRIQRESQTFATITFQNYFRVYEKLAGMTGTAATEQEEFHKIYGLEVIVVPTNKPMIRVDNPDQVYKSEEAKFHAVVNEIEELYNLSRPVLVGTVSIEKSEYLSQLLSHKGIPHQVLNAKHHEKEAAIIAQAGHSKTVTIATNMAGRGVDILLGGNPAGIAADILRRQGRDIHTASPEEMAAAQEEAERICALDREKVLQLSGLHIIGTERHEARRIDNQLRGRSGRQGDPGSSRFYVSLEDELMRRFGGSNIAGLMDRFGLQDDVPIEHHLVSKAIENAQTKVEGYNFDIRKHVVEYDDVMNKQREVIYGDRRKILSQSDSKPLVQRMIAAEIEQLADTYVRNTHPDEQDVQALVTAVGSIFPLPASFDPTHLESLSPDRVEQILQEMAIQAYDKKEQQIGSETARQLERLVVLHVIDHLWVQHLTAIEDLREGIGLRAYGQRDPLVEYKAEAHRMFQDLLANIQRDIVHTIYHVTLQKEAPRPSMRSNREEISSQREPVRAGHKIGRNDPCPCGSGKKYKKCHGR